MSGASEEEAPAAKEAVARLQKAYPGFTEAEIGRMGETATRRFSLHDALVVHRHGPIAPGEPIVIFSAETPATAALNEDRGSRTLR